MPLLSQATTRTPAGGMPTASQPSPGDRMSASHPTDALGTLPNRAACRAQSTSRMSTGHRMSGQTRIPVCGSAGTRTGDPLTKGQHSERLPRKLRNACIQGKCRENLT
jgi:hypothetical protein